MPHSFEKDGFNFRWHISEIQKQERFKKRYERQTKLLNKKIDKMFEKVDTIQQPVKGRNSSKPDIINEANKSNKIVPPIIL